MWPKRRLNARQCTFNGPRMQINFCQHAVNTPLWLKSRKTLSMSDLIKSIFLAGKKKFFLYIREDFIEKLF